MKNLYKCVYCGTERLLDIRRKDNKYCSNRCQIDFQNLQKVKEWKKTGSTGVTGTAPWLKKYILAKQDNKCAECGIGDWNGKPIVFDLEHKDGNSNNNLEDNICCLCPNCHSQTATYKAKNKGNGRHSRRERYTQGKSF
jgi:hypothetical protein